MCTCSPTAALSFLLSTDGDPSHDGWSSWVLATHVADPSWVLTSRLRPLRNTWSEPIDCSSVLSCSLSQTLCVSISALQINTFGEMPVTCQWLNEKVWPPHKLIRMQLSAALYTAWKSMHWHSHFAKRFRDADEGIVGASKSTLRFLSNSYAFACTSCCARRCSLSIQATVSSKPDRTHMSISNRQPQHMIIQS